MFRHFVSAENVSLQHWPFISTVFSARDRRQFISILSVVKRSQRPLFVLLLGTSLCVVLYRLLYLEIGLRVYLIQSGLINNVENDQEYMCNTNKLELFRYIVGLDPVVKQPVLTYRGVGLTALALTVVNEHTVAFLGTDDGRIKKVVLRQRLGAREYGEEVVSPGDAILSDLHYRDSHRKLYVLTSTNVTLLSVESCHNHTSCDTCLGGADPFCAWCSFENKCGVRSSCLKTIRWLHGDKNQCFYIAHISPPSVSVYKAENLYMNIIPSDALADQNVQYFCVFKELNWTSPVTTTRVSASCSSPDLVKLGRTLGDKPTKTVTLALNTNVTGKIFLTKQLSFYNCSNFKTCTSCVDSGFDCDWCVLDNGCYDDTSTCKANIVRSRLSLEYGVKSGNYCPKIVPAMTKKMYLPAGIKQEIVLRGYNFPELKPKTKNYECVLEFSSQRITAPATRHDAKSLTCDLPPLDYNENQGSLEASVSVYWGDNFWLESTSPVKATIYKCDVLANNECSLCINLNYTQRHLGCYWCHGSCQYSSSCRNHFSITTCPAPQIHSVWPLSGPIQGGTNITIEGSNLGAKFEDIENSTMVANVKCEPFKSLYKPSKRIVCETHWRDQLASGPVVVTVNKLSGQFAKHFSFKVRLEGLALVEATVGAGGGTVTGFGSADWLRVVSFGREMGRMRSGSVAPGWV
ncbi:hypothetical protein RRG08_062381 [Elysia crispata]|uniref:Uncharacterized protein n=1 Tax=Elysia crispata TaxID=231223 RepID=A0AAE0YGI0_9GAST|nr:hypothetical protein RRG08_062381 [Elysia crispata]